MNGVIGEVNDERHLVRQMYYASNEEEALIALKDVVHLIVDAVDFENCSDLHCFRNMFVKISGITLYCVDLIDILIAKTKKD